ncbi:lipoyl(octanoyl) transferase LipB [Marichromatium gracile]|uniref:lipoyl(octanoyl) transferase LipB n=1 Tax=Marichromatium gracile TaxID=1048 RepID=UPI001F167C00|nr:lipoyl(octanoyl) transferase LipB [Marichromatium gracile]MCF1182366.1 lipoyl(octanoyl) transferase LipB [Marichromatium gracile]
MSEAGEGARQQTLLIRRLPGLQDYAATLEAMRRFTDARDEDSLDELWLLEHPPVFTLGQAGRREHLLATGDIPVVQVDRGGQVTYHGPGQLVAYLLFDLRRAGIGVKRLVNMLEQTVIELLRDYGVDAERRDNAPGVYVAGAKIASLGLRVRNARSYHGLALNVAMELEPFDRINPCGYTGLAMTQLSEFVAGIGVTDVAGRLVDTLARVFDLEPRWAR